MKRLSVPLVFKWMAAPVLLIFFAGSCNPGTRSGSGDTPPPDFEQIADRVVEKMEHIAGYFADAESNPRSVNADGSIRIDPPGAWTSGFYPGVLWYTYQYSRDPLFRDAAVYHTGIIESQKNDSGTHDIGFQIFCSFGNGLKFGDKEEYRDIILQAASTLSTRYDPDVGCIRSWDWNGDVWEFPVIVDNMMNLEILFWAARESGDSTYYHIARNHALTTLGHHYREDNSSWHVVDFDPATGEVNLKQTHQGYSDESAWSRGQAWGLYGFVMTYRETGEELFLEQATKIARYIMNHPNMPEDHVPYYDFDAPGIPDEPRDASAAAITASALIELYGFTGNDQYLDFADVTLESLAGEPYFIGPEDDTPFLLRHSTGSKPGKFEVDVPIIYADYYFVEALFRRLSLQE